MLNEADYKTIEFIHEFKVASTSTITELFYSSKRTAQKHLTNLVKYKELKRERHSYSDEYIYYIKRSKQMRHNLLLTDYYRELNRKVEIVAFYKEFNKINGIRPDGFVAYIENKTNKIAFIEVEISNKGLDLKKYYDTYVMGEHNGILPTFPKIIVVSDKKHKNPYPIDVEFIKL